MLAVTSSGAGGPAPDPWALLLRLMLPLVAAAAMAFQGLLEASEETARQSLTRIY